MLRSKIIRPAARFARSRGGCNLVGRKTYVAEGTPVSRAHAEFERVASKRASKNVCSRTARVVHGHNFTGQK
eukprot:6366438-Prymnesium_polylepis.1